MKIFTKEWHELEDFMVAVECFEPVPDKDYSDEEFENIYQMALDKHLQEEKEFYEEPPYFDPEEWKEDFPEDEFDPEDFLIEEKGDDDDDFVLRHPNSYEELLEFQKQSFLREVEEYEHQEPFNEEEEKEFFEDMYRSALEEPDEDVPKWISESVDPRLIALNLLPESVYKKLQAEIKEKTPRYEELEKRIEDYYDSQDDDENPELERIEEVLDDLECEDLLSAAEKDGDYVIEAISWDDEGDDQTEVYAVFSDATIIENEDPVIEISRDEDGDVVSNYTILDYELYEEGGKYEVHLLLGGEGNDYKYVTLRRDDVSFQ
jgi:hypothetical protein